MMYGWRIIQNSELEGTKQYFTEKSARKLLAPTVLRKPAECASISVIDQN